MAARADAHGFEMMLASSKQVNIAVIAVIAEASHLCGHQALDYF